ncbi:hypothetical protein PIROE2DRAFT_9529 [Piromyces sp. E2]|nr:hypothetical protein PIROE2DRAFT_9529 [Piromyces sp. E2]|eukprot:OUM63860.1 hypothetical protein PIROE2DRAFT_9529 [Piromyces sp. E2]
MNNIKFSNITCIGDSGDASFILYNSDENKGKLDIKNLDGKDSLSNGPFIKVIGNSNSVAIYNSSLNNIISYGPIIKISSKKSVISMKNLKFSNNTNNNKFECGCIRFSNDLDISVSNSEFYNNYSKGDGGAICIDNITNMKLDLISNNFRKNHGINGGALYLSSNDNENNENNEDTNEIKNINDTINFENNFFEGNKAEDFGGAIYSTFNKLYLTKSVNNSIIENDAGIMGGGVYTPSRKDQNMFDINNFIFEKNTVNLLQINNYTTKPYYISLDSLDENGKYNITSGESISLKFSLLDEYNQTIRDITKYYSLLTLKLSLQDINKNDMRNDKNKNLPTKNTNFQLTENIGTFVNGNS